MDEKDRSCYQSFVLTERPTSAIRRFANIVGMKKEQMEMATTKDFIGKQLKVRITISEDGYTAIDHWYKLPPSQDSLTDEL